MGLFAGKCRSTARLDGKTAVITGCNTGIGKVTAMHLCKIGARVVMACRDVQKAEEAAAEIRAGIADTAGAGQLVVRRLDLAHLQSVRECARDILETEAKIHILINNAGIMACPRMETEDGLEMQLGVNHFGHFLFTCLLLPRLIQSAPARVVTLSSLAHTSGRIDFDDLNSTRSYQPFKAYQQSKLANVLFSKELARRLEGVRGPNGGPAVTTYAVHPGVVRTELGRHLDGLYFKGARVAIGMLFRPIFKNPVQGAQTTIHCSIDEEAANETGLYYSDCKVKQPSSRAEDLEVAKRLWDESVKIVNLGDFDPFKPA
ncbi:retinol dehydrogenase 13-like [Thrips palmi]|uniref:Retinol dehydrogenase 13-like n=1 Tax=Thrips palmi TaxID=161013 RepID=A0A6P8YIX2_THRPL|nr:retinol dehydrogenase 13-like [Thrips palmi]